MKRLQKIVADDNRYNIHRKIELQVGSDIRTIVDDLDDTLLQLREEYIQLYGIDYVDVIESEIRNSIIEYRFKPPKDHYRKEYDDKYLGW